MSRATPRFPLRLLLPVVVSSVAAARVPHVAPWALAVLGAGFVARLALLATGVEPGRARFWFALSLSVPSAATAWVALEAHAGGAAGPALVSVACALLGLSLAGPATSAALARVVVLSLAQVVGAAVLAPDRALSGLVALYVAALVPALARVASSLGAPRRSDTGAQIRRVRAEDAPRRSGVPGAVRFLAAALPLGLWFFCVLPHRASDAGGRGGAGAARATVVGGADAPAAAAAGPRESSFSSFVSGGKTSMRLGFVAKVKQSQRPVLLVTLDGGVAGPREPLTLRGFVYDVFTGTEWTRADGRIRPTSAVPEPDGWVSVAPATPGRRRHLLRIEDVAGDEGSRLFLAPEPIRVRLDARLGDGRVGTTPDGVVGSFAVLPPGGTYEEEAEFPDPDRAGLSGRRSDAGVAPSPRLVEAPPEVERYRALAREVVGTASDPAERAARLERWLRTSFRYTTDMPEPDRRRPVLDFLERIRRGHCEYFASSMTLLLRALGHPARLAVGFRGGDFLPTRAQWSFRGNHAHAWCEVYFEGVGFVAYDPTPPADPGADRTTGAGAEADGPSFLERLLRFSADDRRELGLGAQRALRAVGAVVLGESPLGPWPVVGVALLLAALVAGARRRRARALGATDRRGWPLGPYGLALAALARAGLPRAPAEAASEYVRRVARSRPELAPPLVRLTALHDAVRFGGRAAARETLDEAARIADAIRALARGSVAPAAPTASVPG